LLEGSIKRLAAPETPNYALDNAGLFEWNAGATAGYRAGAADYRVSYRHYNAKLGVCACLRVHNIGDFLAQAEAGEPIGADEYHADFTIDRPYQAVAHDLALARSRWERDHLGTFTATYSFQHDLRREYDVVRNADTAGSTAPTAASRSHRFRRSSSARRRRSCARKTATTARTSCSFPPITTAPRSRFTRPI
jgi:iron complex outermembrane receptor protein